MTWALIENPRLVLYWLSDKILYICNFFVIFKNHPIGVKKLMIVSFSFFLSVHEHNLKAPMLRRSSQLRICDWKARLLIVPLISRGISLIMDHSPTDYIILLKRIPKLISLSLFLSRMNNLTAFRLLP